MRAWIIGVIALAAAALAVVAVPWAVTRILESKGVVATDVRWCRAGLCFGEVLRGADRAGAVEVGWDRRVRVIGAEVGLPSPGGEPGGGTALPVREITVENLTIRGVPVPPLTGTVYPERHLAGDGVEIEGSTAHARVPTDYGEVRVEVTPADGGLSVTASCTCRFFHASLAESAVEVAVRAQGTYDGGGFLGSVNVGEVALRVDAHRNGASASGTFNLATTDIADLYDLLGDVVPEARRASIGGTLAGSGTFDFATPSVTFEPVLAGLTVRGVLPSGYEGGPFRREVRTATDERAWQAFGEGTGGWTALAEMGTLLPQAAIAAEDARFREHPGYDLAGMLTAAKDNASRGEMWRGGSTLTQQLAKNLFLDGTRTYSRKLRELLYAVEMEETLGKMRILELYLNVVEFGPGIYGARQASLAYFLKSPAGLLPEEAAWLASILPQPRTAWHQQYLRDRPNVSRVQAILDGMRTLDDASRDAAKQRRIRFVPPG